MNKKGVNKLHGIKSNSLNYVPPSKKKNITNKLDSYDLGTKEWEDKIMFQLKVMRVCLIVYVIIALLLPMYKGSGFFIDSFSTVIVIILLVCGLASCYGRFMDFNPMFIIALVRGVHVLLNFFFFKQSINYLFSLFQLF